MTLRNGRSLFVLAILAVAGLAACQQPARRSPPAPAPTREATAPDDTAAPEPVVQPPFAGTAWRLVELQSMDDAQGIRRPSDPARYTMRLEADGRVSMRLDCNQASGNWKAEPAPGDPSSGGFTFGPLATTFALCPEPSLGEVVSLQAQYVRGYLVKDGRLNLSLLADGGIQVWEPLVESSDHRPD